MHFSHCRSPSASSDHGRNRLCLDKDQPYALPSPDALAAAAFQWIQRASCIDKSRILPCQLRTRGSGDTHRKEKEKAWKLFAFRQRKGAARRKKPTLAASWETLMQTIPALTTQVQTLTDRQQKMEERLGTSRSPSTLGLLASLTDTLQEMKELHGGREEVDRPIRQCRPGAG